MAQYQGQMYAQPPHQPPQNLSITWRPIRGLWGLCFKILILRIVTLNIYHFWAKTEVRRKLWSAVHLQGQPLEYTGRGLELFLGFLVVFFLVLLPIVAALIGIQLYVGQDPKNAIYIFLYSLPIYILIIYLFGVAQYRARRYRLSRTNWRGIRGTMLGSSWGFGWTSFWTIIPVVLTLGWALPWRANKLQRVLTTETRFGNVPMNYDGTSGPLYLPFSVLWTGIVGTYFGLVYLSTLIIQNPEMAQEWLPTPDKLQDPNYVLAFYGAIIIAVIVFALIFSILSAWYTARMFNYFAYSTTFDNARFKMGISAIGLIWLIITNTLLVILTLGIAGPIALARVSKYIVTNMGIDGTIDFARIAQSQAEMDRMGEGLAEAFDIDGI